MRNKTKPSSFQKQYKIILELKLEENILKIEVRKLKRCKQSHKHKKHAVEVKKENPTCLEIELQYEEGLELQFSSSFQYYFEA